MQLLIPTAPASPAARWTGYALSALASLFLLFDGVIKVIQHPAALSATTQLGYAANQVLPIGLVELGCLLLYLIPQTAVLGALLFTGYLGGAIATQVRASADWFSLLFPVILGGLLWGGLYLHDPQLRRLLPFRR